MTGTVTSVATYRSLSSRPVRNRAFIFILRVAITFNDSSKVSEGLDYKDGYIANASCRVLEGIFRVICLDCFLIKIGNIQKNRQMSDQSKKSANSGHIILSKEAIHLEPPGMGIKKRFQ